MYRSTSRVSSPKLRSASRRAAAIASSSSRRRCTRRIPLPPPPADGLSSTGRPTASAALRKRVVGQSAPSLPGTTGRPARRRAASPGSCRPSPRSPRPVARRTSARRRRRPGRARRSPTGSRSRGAARPRPEGAAAARIRSTDEVARARPPSGTATSARATCGASRSTSVYTAIGAHPHRLHGADDAHGDLATVGDEHGFERWSVMAPLTSGTPRSRRRPAAPRRRRRAPARARRACRPAR